MKLMRGIIRLLTLMFITAGLAIVFLTGRILLSPFPKRGLRWRNWHFRNWARFVVQLLNIEIKTRNLPPRAPFLLVCNHLSYIDIVVLASQLDCTFIAKSEVSRWPIIGLLGRSVDTIFINRKQRRSVVSAMNQAETFIQKGLGVVLFAEGTSTSGQNVSPFKTSLLEFAARKDVPVHYASISYATALNELSADQCVCWWGNMTFTNHFFRLLQLQGFETKLTFGREPIIARDRRALAAKLWQAVNAQFIPVPVNR